MYRLQRQAWLLLQLAALLTFASSAEVLQSFQVPEGSPVGTLIGVIGEVRSGLPQPPQPPYLIVPQDGDADDLIINQQTGEIRTKSVLDREKTASYILSAIPVNGETVKVEITITDINDNSPEFSPSQLEIDIPENTPIGTRRKLPKAIDRDLNNFATQGYKIEGGNIGDAFDISTVKGVELELVVAGELDRENVPVYNLQITATDGGSPPRTGTLSLKINIQDLNDSPPFFSKQRYFTSILDDAQVGSSVIKVTATDADEGSNGAIKYLINRKQSDKKHTFNINENTGLIVLAKNVDFEQQRVHEIVVVARDGGEVPQETSAFVTVRVNQGHSDPFNFPPPPSPVPPITTEDSASQIKIVNLDGSDFKGVAENAELQVPFAKFSIRDGSESRRDFNNIIIKEQGPPSPIKLLRNGTGVFLYPDSNIDYENQKLFSLRYSISDDFRRFETVTQVFKIPVLDVNDNPPKFDQEIYDLDLIESTESGSPVLAVKASDIDSNENGRITYSFQYNSRGKESNCRRH